MINLNKQTYGRWEDVRGFVHDDLEHIETVLNRRWAATFGETNQIVLTTNVSGTLPADNGGTGFSSYAVGDILAANTTTSLSKIADVATGNALISGGVGVLPQWGKIGLTTHVSGVLPVANGGTNKSSWTAGSIVFADAAGTALTQDNANLFFDDTNNRLGVGTNAPTNRFHLKNTGANGYPDGLMHETTASGTTNYSSMNLVNSSGDFGQIFLTSAGYSGLPAVTARAVGFYTSGSGGISNVVDSVGSFRVTVGGIATTKERFRVADAGSTFWNTTTTPAVEVGYHGANGSGLITSWSYDQAPPSSVAISAGAVFGLNGSATNFYGIGLDGLRNSKYDVWFQTGAINGGGYRFYIATTEKMTMDYQGRIGIGQTAPTAFLHLKAGTTAASSAPLKLTSGTNMTSAEAGAIEFTTDDFFATITTGPARKAFVLDDGTRLTATRVPVAATNGRLTDTSNLTYDSGVLSVPGIYTDSLVSLSGAQIDVAASLDGAPVEQFRFINYGLGDLTGTVMSFYQTTTELARITAIHDSITNSISSLRFGVGSAGTERFRMDSFGRFVVGSVTNNRAVHNPVLYGATTDAATAVELTTDGAAGSGSTNRISVPVDSGMSVVLNISVKQSGSANAKQMLRQFMISNNGGTTALQGAVTTLGTDVGSAGLATVTCTITANDTNDCIKVEVNGVVATNLRYTAYVVSTETIYS